MFVDLDWERVVLAMSGGVDSTASAIILRDIGYKVTGVMMRVASESSSNIDDAVKMADQIGIDLSVIDLRKDFANAVIEPFVSSYVNGFTPNPCVTCNRRMKFSKLRQYAKQVGAAYLATGHYARIEERDGGYYDLGTARHVQKDQSYFLYSLTQQDLASTLFPLGDWSKLEARELLRANGLAIADKDESQDICFIQGSVADFIENRANILRETYGSSYAVSQEGDIVDANGHILGSHRGIHRFTIGQRRGLGISSPNPLYVIALEPETKRVVVGPKQALQQESFLVSDLNWISGHRPQSSFRVFAKLRYRHSGTWCRVQPEGKDRVRVIFDEQWTSVCPGQSAVFYTDLDNAGGRDVIGGGIIQREGIL